MTIPTEVKWPENKAGHRPQFSAECVELYLHSSIRIRASSLCMNFSLPAELSVSLNVNFSLRLSTNP